MKISNSLSFTTVVTVSFLLIGPSSTVVSAVNTDSPVAAALRDAFMHNPSRRHLQDSNVCAEASSVVDSCLPDSVQSDCVNCMTASFQAALSTFSSSSKDCQALAEYTCAPVHSCECLSQCSGEFTLLANCMSDAIVSGAGYTGNCDVTCGTFSSSRAPVLVGSATLYTTAAATAAAGLLALAYFHA